MSQSNVSAKKAFECRQCGECCRGEGGIVLKPKDQSRLADHLGMDTETFLERYAEMRNGKYYLRTKEDGYCVFFGKNCEVHSVKPDVCRAWPYFRGNLVDEVSWAMAQDFCPGIIAETGHKAFVREGREYLRMHGLLDEDGANALKP